MRHRTDTALEGGSLTFACSVDERRSQDSALRDWIGGRRRGSALWFSCSPWLVTGHTFRDSPEPVAQIEICDEGRTDRRGARSRPRPSLRRRRSLRCSRARRIGY
jgi:hypothetical protein